MLMLPALSSARNGNEEICDMNRNSTSGLPIWAIVLDVFGTVLVGGGIYVLVSSAEFMGMQPADLKGPAIAMITVGGMLMVPLLVAIVKLANAKR